MPNTSTSSVSLDADLSAGGICGDAMLEDDTSQPKDEPAPERVAPVTEPEKAWEESPNYGP